MLAAQGGFFSVRATQGGEPKKAQARGSGAEVNGQRAATKGRSRATAGRRGARGARFFQA